MKIRPKNIPTFLNGGISTVNWSNPNSTWFTRSGNRILEGTYNKLKALHDKWQYTKDLADYLLFKNAVDEMNNDQRTGYAPGYLKYSTNGQQLFSGNNVENWLNRINSNYLYINDAIGENFKLYHITSPSPNSGDNKSKRWHADGYWAGITQDRTPWGYYNDENDSDYQNWKLKFSEIGIDYKPNSEWGTGNVLYGFLKGDNTQTTSGTEVKKTGPNEISITVTENKPDKYKVTPNFRTPTLTVGTDILASGGKKYGFDWSKIGQTALKILGNPNLYGLGRLAGNLANNEKVYDESLKGIKPILRQTYNTHRQVLGDEATKQAYYRRAALGLTTAARPFTSDADRQTAYQMEAKRAADELRALGDLADNQEIRRTSDESNQHQWANAQRATEVANANIASINQANSLKHNLLAQKHSAQWSSIDNFLSEIEYRKRQQLAEDLAFDDLLFMLNLDEFQYTPEYAAAYKKYNDVLEKHKKADNTYDQFDPEVITARGEFLNFIKEQKRKLLLELLKYKRNRNSTYFIKNGSKITHKKKDDLLYKSAKDVVEHFRKMSKISSDSQNRKNPKIEKLTSHPKGRTKKYLLGGVAPFTVYKPISLGGETTTSSQRDTSSTSKKEGKDETLDMIKELFKAVAGKGLTSDVNNLYISMLNFLSKSKLLGEELSTDDIASMYLSQMQKLNQIQGLKENFDKNKQIAIENGALGEIAVDSTGKLVVQDDNGKITTAESVADAREKGLRLITNNLLLSIREFSPEYAGRFDLDQIAANGIGIDKITQYIKQTIPTIGTDKLTEEGYTKVQAGQIQEGFESLLGQAPDGHYLYERHTEDQSRQRTMAINYIKAMLPTKMKAVLKAHADLQGISYDKLILLCVSAGEESVESLKFTPVTGKAAKEGKEDDLDKLGINSATLLLLGMSSPREFTFNIGNGNSFTGAARVSSITKDGNPFGADFTYSEIYKSDLHKNLDLDNASFGDVPINKSLKDRIVIDNSTIAGVDLPYTTDRNGRIIPDFLMLNRIEEADLEILRSGIDPNKDPQKVNEIYAKHKLPIKYGADNKLTGNYKRFAVVLATAIEDVFLNKDGLASNGTLTLVSDENEINKYLNEIKKTTGEKEIDMDRPGLGTGDKDIYKGSIFIPIIGDLVDAVSATGGLNAGNYDELRSKYLTRNYNKAPLFVKQ